MEALLMNMELDKINKVIMEEFAKAQDSDYNRIKFLMFSTILTRCSDSVFLQQNLDKFPMMTLDKISINELKNIIGEFKISAMENIEDIFKPDCEIHLIHLYLLMSKKPDLNMGCHLTETSGEWNENLSHSDFMICCDLMGKVMNIYR